jgi:glycosyltransferase involved in cell wall biosynthesis
MERSTDISIVFPCLNEEKTISICIRKAKEVLKKEKLHGEIIVVDNASTDNSRKIAEKEGANVVEEPIKGYGAAYIKGFSVAKGKIIVMCDSDNTYDLNELPALLDNIGRYDIIMGNRMKKKNRSSMPWLHRHIGNPLLTLTLNLFFNLRLNDTQSGLRVFKRKIIDTLSFTSIGMEFASEFLIKTSKAGYKIKEVPIRYRPRQGESKLSSFKDGWRILRFMLLYSPFYLFFVPGLLIFVLGFLMMAILLPGPLNLKNFVFDIHPMVLGSGLCILGFQIINLGIYAKVYAVKQKIDRPSRFMRFLEKNANFRRGMLLGSLTFMVGFAYNLFILLKWVYSGFQGMNELRTSIFFMTFIIIGMQIIFSSFYLSVIEVKR